MKKLEVLISLIVLALTKSIIAANMSDYCYTPPFMGTSVAPNVLLVVDVSGSMSWCAYNPSSDKSGCCSSSSGCGWTYQGTEEGYFDPTKVYKYQSQSQSKSQSKSGVWVETTGTPASCPKTSGDINTNSLYQGSCLNFLYMTRIDLVRWALTGGTPSSCSNGQPSQCDPELYPSNNNQLSCDSSGCTLQTYKGVQVKARWDRITGNNGGLLYQLKNLSLKPRFGVMFYSGSGVRNTKVYIGDFTASANFDGVNPYKNTISAVNYIDPSGSTPTALALWDAYNYFAQKSPQYGGFQPQTGNGSEWKNPMYQCFDDNNDGNCQGNEFKLVPCAKNFVILLTDGQWNTGANGYNTCSIDSGYENASADPVVPAYWLHKKGFTNQKTNIFSYVDALYGIGLWLGGTGERSLKNVAMYGSFDRNKNWPDSLSDYPKVQCGPITDCCNSNNCGKGSPCANLPSSSPDWDKDGNGIPDTFFSASDAKKIKESMMSAILDILRRASSGSTVATLSTKTAISSLLVQPYFYPSYTDSKNNTVSWIGFLRSFWVDPKNDTREDTNPNKILNLNSDKIFQTYFDTNSNETKAALLDSSSTCQSTGTKKLNELIPIFNSSCWLSTCDPSSDRKIYFNSGTSLKEFSESNSTDLENIWDYVDDNTSNNSISSDTAKCVIRYLRGEDLSNDTTCQSVLYVQRSLNVNIKDFGCSSTDNIKKWKLGDIIYSTPSVVSNEPLRTYHLKYGDNTYYQYISSTNYKNRPSYVVVGANDGMLHFFRMGTIIDQSNTDQNNPVKLQNSPADPANDEIGKEEFAFIPKYAIPYLLWYGKQDYCHIPTIDSRTFIFDTSIDGSATDTKTKDSWRTVLVGVMGFGGKSIQIGSQTYSSSIYVLDLTDWLNGTTTTPTLLWEKPLPDNTLTLSYPSVVRIGDYNNNGNWYVVIGSGPKNPSPSSDSDFSSSPKLYFFDLKDGTLVKTLNISLPNNTVAAVADSMPVDVDYDYSDDAIYFGVYGLQKQGNNWYNYSNFYRLVIKNKAIGNLSDSDITVAVDMSSFKNSNHIPPITAAPTFTKDETGKLWVFFGTGRYLTESDKSLSYNNYFIGFKDQCWDGSCSTAYTKTDFTDTTSENIQATITDIKQMCICDTSGCSNRDIVYYASGNEPAEVQKGWYKTLTNEAVISQGIVFGSILDFLTFVPPNDICAFEGSSNLYALYYKSGTAYPNPAILSPSAVTGTIEIGQNVTVNPKISLGTGIPPTGNPFQVSVSQNNPNQYEKFIQLSTGAILRQKQQPVPTSKGRFKLWIEK
ncbi:MAG: PilC/PilY family type IV pilus protein [Hydrogenothermaceae bacterium]|nr:PilC/PilY family type IV pilus protein [Hydrogenothermaceae bacterium]